MSMRITRRAEADIVSLHEYISAEASSSRADKIANGIFDLCETLTEFPDQGHFPPELEGHQRTDLREVRFKPYRILYRVHASKIDVLAIFDGRRDARSLIDQRMLRS
jgi:toxin ParE1/3/4